MQRKDRVRAAYGKITPPFTLDETLTFFCPQENVDALDHPSIRAFHDHMLTEYQPATGDEMAVMLMLPCTKTKPYSLSTEHQAINTYLLSISFQPIQPADYPSELKVHYPLAQTLFY